MTAQSKALVVFSDGTGNSSAKLFKTNVWRLHEAVDTSSPKHRQIVAYDDGVGTSSFKPLALLGGIFGVGLKRNVLELYRFVCRNYEPGDRIYAFGFSRGAFTIRVLVGLITTVGVIRPRTIDHAALELLSEDAYRSFRRHFRLSGNRSPAAERRPDLTDMLVTPLRKLRDKCIEWKRAMRGQPTLGGAEKLEVDEIAFVGVWDTVAAYGFPIAEITKGIDRWVWPLSMPDYKLSEKVRRARHALALDDERDTFHPLLWDEAYERELIKDGDMDEARMRQVWFAGMHSDVGGGYSDDSLAYVSLVWMAEEAERAGLKLRDDAIREFREKANPLGPIHDSRSGVAAYYRYQPRRISARVEPPDPTTRIMQDPDGQGLLTSVRVHVSVLDRIAASTDGYAPIVLPESYMVEGGSPRELRPEVRAAGQERVWDAVWRRRVNYFATLALTIALVAIGFTNDAPASCVGPQCVISPMLQAIGAFLPDFAERWVAAYAGRPGTFLLLAAAVFVLLGTTRRTELRMRDRMRSLFRMSMSAEDAEPAASAAANEDRTLVRRLRTHSVYQRTLQFVKWRANPGLAAAVIYSGLIVVAVFVLGTGLSLTHRTYLAFQAEALCEPGKPGVAEDDGTGIFSTSSVCWRMNGVSLEQGKRYRLSLTVEAPWLDGRIVASPAGFSSDSFEPWLRLPAAMLRRSLNDPWFQPLIHAADYRFGYADSVAVRMRLADYEHNVYVGEFIAPGDGPVRLTVNDAMFLWGGVAPDYFYRGGAGHNHGHARVAIEICDDPKTAPPCAAPTDE